MSEGRMVDPAFWKSEAAANLRIEERYLFLGLLANADDQGRIPCEPDVIRRLILPKADFADVEIIFMLAMIQAAGFIHIYEADGLHLAQLTHWWTQPKQGARASIYPAPAGWQDKVGYEPTIYGRPNATEWEDLRRIVFKRDRGRCAYCGAPAEHLDHVVPICQGGTNNLDNLVAACANCNLSKGGRTPEQAGMELKE